MIYFIQDTRTFAIKIGYTGSEPEARMAALQTGNPGELWLLCTMPGDLAREAELHRDLADSRERGEWFRPTPQVLDVIIQASRFHGYESGFAAGEQQGFRDGSDNGWDDFQRVDGLIVETTDEGSVVYEPVTA